MALRGIRLSHGAVFVTDGTFTVRLLPSGECGLSPILYTVLERDLAFEHPSTWEYLTEGDILGLPNGGGERILAALQASHGGLKPPLGKKQK